MLRIEPKERLSAKQANSKLQSIYYEMSKGERAVLSSFTTCASNLETGRRIRELDKVDLKDNQHETALLKAAERGRDAVVQLLLDKGTEVNAQGGYYGNALQAASAKGHEKVVEMLLDKGAEVNVRDEVNAQDGVYGNALQAASEEGHEKAVQMLLDDANAYEGQSDDALSEVSSAPPSLISNSTDSSMQDNYNHIVEHLVEIFCAEENTGPIYREAVENFRKDKFCHNHDQLLKLYFKQLRLEIKNENELAVIRLLRTRRYRNEVTSLILKEFLQPFEGSGEGWLTASLLAERKPDCNYSLNKMLGGVAVGPDSYNDHKKPQNGNNNHEDDASESSGSSTKSEDEPLIRNQQSPLQAIDAFLTGGKAFTQLKVNLASILHPPLSFENALSSKSVFVIRQYISRHLNSIADNDKEQIMELRKKGQSNAKIA
ncbi:hypothetical protein GJ744_004650 [Endocarpon pusillum]|uniref:Uncharacterized protein n=1 Tax=Endocarpon pusillum TaxID=364733 RepID=A0A8H7AR12_9EURO|nr:hypothetical protein GJ744_004650 [Endocarpon pusillum]